jgi:hypothetical protein
MPLSVKINISQVIVKIKQSISNSYMERVKDCDKMKVAKGKVNLYLACICFGIR